MLRRLQERLAVQEVLDHPPVHPLAQRCDPGKLSGNGLPIGLRCAHQIRQDQIFLPDFAPQFADFFLHSSSALLHLRVLLRGKVEHLADIRSAMPSLMFATGGPFTALPVGHHSERGNDADVESQGGNQEQHQPGIASTGG
jgi:hypothetical protein